MADPEFIATSAQPGNDDVDWDAFDPVAYFETNYHRILDQDAAIIDLVADFFHAVAPDRPGTRALDVGSGANLYPAMTMLPFASEIVLCERARSNLTWLRNELRAPARSWEAFWSAVRGERLRYGGITEPFTQLDRAATVVEGNLFDLAPREYDIGTMFFVAESVTTRIDEFRHAIRSFVGSLVAGAPFAAAFMRESSGYTVAGKPFPACRVTEREVRDCLTEVARVEDIHVIANGIRHGSSGMIVAYGRQGR